MRILEVKARLLEKSSATKASVLRKFFKTGPGEYGHGDIFIGVIVPDIRSIAKKYQNLSFPEVLILLKSKIHEERFLALLILVCKYTKADNETKAKIYKLYLSYTKYINNWDLVDLTARDIIGSFLWDKDKQPLYNLAESKLIWDRRIAIVATYFFIKQGKFNDTLNIAKILLNDKEDLIHKAVGWMLREVGKKDFKTEEEFLKKYYKIMPRTMLRYAIEHFPEQKRKRYLLGMV